MIFYLFIIHTDVRAGQGEKSRRCNLSIHNTHIKVKSPEASCKLREWRALGIFSTQRDADVKSMEKCVPMANRIELLLITTKYFLLRGCAGILIGAGCFRNSGVGY